MQLQLKKLTQNVMSFHITTFFDFVLTRTVQITYLVVITYVLVYTFLICLRLYNRL